MPPSPTPLDQYHIFLASPGDVNAERRHVRGFFDRFNRDTAPLWNARFQVIDWENYATIGVGRPQALITRQTLEKYRGSLALVIGIMGQRFGSPSGEAESGTEEEFHWAMEYHRQHGFPEIKWFFRKVDNLTLPPDPDKLAEAVKQWKKVLAFRQRMESPPPGAGHPVFYAEYSYTEDPGAAGFAEVFDQDLNRWLADPARDWVKQANAAASATSSASSAPVSSPPASSTPISSTSASAPAPSPPLPEFDAGSYRAAIGRRFGTLGFDMLDTSGASGVNYSGVKLWKVFVPQSVRESREYNPRLLEIPKEQQKRLLAAGELDAEQLPEDEQQAERLRREYFEQPPRPVLEVVNAALDPRTRTEIRPAMKLVLLGDPGAGKSSLVRYLALAWADRTEGDEPESPVPLVVELEAYGRWQRAGPKGFLRYLEEALGWHGWPPGLLARWFREGRAALLLDGLDEVFDPVGRRAVLDDIQRFAGEYPDVPVLVTSRVVGYQPQRLRDAGFRHFMLQDLNTRQIGDFIQRWHTETFDDTEQGAAKRARLEKAIKGSKPIALLAGNPLLLTLMAILNRNQELPRDRADLYEQASRLLLHQWDTERALVEFPGLGDDIGPREKAAILRRVAEHMQASPGGLKGNLLDGKSLEGIIEGYLGEELHLKPAQAAAWAVVEHLRERNFILCFVGADSYAFVHRTFLEYFCAAGFVHRFEKEKSLTVEDLIQLFDEHYRDDGWREVLRLICGQIDERFVGRIVEHLAGRVDWDYWDGRTPLPELPLAIQCLGETRSPAKLVKAGDLLMGCVIRYFSREEIGFFDSLSNDLLSAGKELGPRWPLGEPLSRRALAVGEAMTDKGADVWPEFVAAVEPDRAVIEGFLTSANEELRTGACDALAANWPDGRTRQWLERRAMEDEHELPRRTALGILAEHWPDGDTRRLLKQRAVADEHGFLRSTALGILAKKWPDDATRQLLARRAVADEYGLLRRTALEILAENWPDDATRELLGRRAVEDPDARARGEAFRLLGGLHSKFGRILATKDLDGGWPYLDPLKPIPRAHIEQAAKQAGIAPGAVDAQVASLSEYLGWDVSRGAGEPQPKIKSINPRRKSS
uniref:NACHT domain-containing protein n=1 Tax=Candidatus Kentrum sp. FM TaxID=2126340 RepID=A0A450STU5_9GAMM|nr:MAG: NACHT domain-containing protein [Candidatus Kentron sp. FM]VFK11812.1 MAG: NACHT domain-containing protein [Candidatus Kentron sp. FM]